MEFTHKARLVPGGHTTKITYISNYSSVVSRKSVRIAMVIAALNDLKLEAGDIQNAYLTAPCLERIYIICGPEFGPDNQGKTAIIIRSLYGLISSGKAIRNHLSAGIKELGWIYCKADADVYYHSATRPDGVTYYSYLLTYVDDLLCISNEPSLDLDKLDKYFKMKVNSRSIPKSYLGGQMNAVILLNNVQAWSFNSGKYVQEAISNVEKHIFTEYDTHFPMRVTTSFTSAYRPELDTSRELTDERVLYFMSLIGILRWAVELGRIDITTEVSELSSFLAAPWDGHLNQALYIFVYLKKHHNSGIVFDPTYPDINEDDFKTGIVLHVPYWYLKMGGRT